MIKDDEITFVVQGPIGNFCGRKQKNNSTNRCLQSIRCLFPDSKIILSTWKGQNTDSLDYDLLLELDDPGPNIVHNNNAPQHLNNNRQIFSTHMGLKKVKTKYAVKIRTDNFLFSKNFIEIYQNLFSVDRESESVLFKQRVLTSSAFFISHHRGERNYFCKSDLFDFGLTEDLLKIWSKNLIDEKYFFPIKGYKSRPPATEQFLCLKWIAELTGKELHMNNRVNDDASLGKNFWDKCIAANLIVATPEELGLDVTDKFYKRGNLIFEYDLKDWKILSGLLEPRRDLKSVLRIIRIFVEKTKRKIYDYTQLTS